MHLSWLLKRVFFAWAGGDASIFPFDAAETIESERNKRRKLESGGHVEVENTVDLSRDVHRTGGKCVSEEAKELDRVSFCSQLVLFAH